MRLNSKISMLNKNFPGDSNFSKLNKSGESMLKKVIALFIITTGITAFAGTELKINGEFKNVKGNLPEGWVQNKFGRPKLYGTVEIVKESEENLLKITSDEKTLHVFTGKYYTAKAGDKIELKIKAKGKGKAIIGIYTYTAKHWAGSEYKSFTLTDKEIEIKFVFTIKNAKIKNKVLEVAKIRVTVGTYPNSTMTISEVKAEILDEKK